MIVDVPGDTPVANPAKKSTVATIVLLLVQLPLPLASLRNVLVPGHSGVEPMMAEGSGFTVNGVDITQPEVGTV